MLLSTKSKVKKIFNQINDSKIRKNEMTVFEFLLKNWFLAYADKLSGFLRIQKTPNLWTNIYISYAIISRSWRIQSKYKPEPKILSLGWKLRR